MYDNGDSFEFPDDSSPDLNSGDDVTPTAIVMVSPPETSDDEDPNCSSSTNNNRASQDVFQTPPEDAHPPTSDGITPFPEVNQSDDDDDRPYEDAGDGRGVTSPSGHGCTDGATGGVDLGRDTDLKFSKAETMGIAGFMTELAWQRGRFESPLKKLRVSENELGKLELKEMVPHSPCCKSLEIDGGDEKSSEEILEVRKLDSSEDEHESCMEESKSDSEEEESIQDILKRTPNVTIEELRRIERLWLQRELPRSIGGQAGSSANGAKEGKPEEVAILDVLKLLKDKYRLWLQRELPRSIGGQAGSSANGAKEGKPEEVAILDVLKLLKDKYDGNGNDEIDKSSFLEISKRRGMTFPRPSWWPEGGF